MIKEINIDNISNGDMLEILINKVEKKEIIKKYSLHENNSFIRVVENEYIFLLNITNAKEKEKNRLKEIESILDIINSINTTNYVKKIVG